ncbi:MAG: hypothetical protein LQ338_005261 [Usnochroma carphineum]|nr:MAG: hypothetical protein LQ338_005261 [Usnochroma carphineum]
MPTLYARGINIRLSVADLEKTSTSAPVNTLCKESTSNADRAVQQFENDAKNGMLAETPLWPDEDGCRLGFLGDHEHVPFIMVHTSPEYPFHTNTTNMSQAKAKPAPLQLITHNDNEENLDSPLSDLSSSPLSPVPTLDNIEVRADQPMSNGGTHSLQRRTSKPPIDGGGYDGPSLSVAELPVANHNSAAGPSITTTSINSPSTQLHPSDIYFRTKGALHDQTPNPQQPQQPQQPQALCLRVLPKTNSFLSKFDRDNARWNVNDIKIDVYLNGDLCASAFVAERAFHGKGYLRDTFSGARNHRLTEIPWVLMPPSSDSPEGPNGRTPPEKAARDAESRWTDVSDALRQAAESNGRNKRNELSTLGQYLQSLAAIPMPATLPGMLKTNHRCFAIIDVIVTTGKGHKDDASGAYLFRPIPLKLHGHGIHKEYSPVKKLEAQKKQLVTAKDHLARAKRSFADEEITAQAFSLHHVPRTSMARNLPGKLTLASCDCKEDRAEHPIDASISGAYHSTISINQSRAEPTDSTPSAATDHAIPLGPPTRRPRRIPSTQKKPGDLGANRPEGVASQSTPIPRKRPDESSPAVPAPTRIWSRTSTTPTTMDEPAVKKKRIHYYDVLDTRQTMAEEMEDIARQAANPEAIFFTDRRVTRSKLADNSDGADAPPINGQLVNSTAPTTTLAFLPLAPGPNTQNRPLPTAIPDKAPPLQAMPAPSLQLRQRRSSPTTPVNRADSSSPEKPLRFRHRTSSHLPDTPHESATSPQPHSSGTSASAKPPFSKKKSGVKANQLVPWATPPLSKDSIVTYAEDGRVRQVRAERGGWFSEEGVLVGVRFVVG